MEGMLAREVGSFFDGEIYEDAETCARYSRDYSIFRVTPRLVVAPKDEGDVKKLVRFVARKREQGDHALSLTARAAGTDMTGGPLTDSIVVLCTEHVNHIKEIGADYAVVEPGVYFRDLERILHERRLLYPPYPASKDLCAIGGIVNNNSGGEKTLSYGKTADYVERLRMVLADGEAHVFAPLTPRELEAKLKETGFESDLYRGLYALIESHYDRIQRARPDVSKNSAGYALWDVWDKKRFDMTRLFVGAQGTLGIMTEAKLKLVPVKSHHALGVIFLKDMAYLPAVIEKVMAAHPETFESFDDRTMEIALRFLPGLVRSMKMGLLTLAWQFLPEFMMALRGGLPKLVLLAEFTAESGDALKRALAKFTAGLAGIPAARVRVIEREREEQKYWTVRRQSFALLHEHNKNKSTVPFIDDIVVRPEHLPEFLPRVNELLAAHKNKMVYTIAGHVGDGNFHIIPLMDMRDPEVHRIIPKLSEQIYALVKRYRGSITAEHNDGLIRTPYLKQMYGEEMCRLFEDVKRLFDPENIFNPRKKVGGDLRFAAAHMSYKNF